jgi:hypothetical protein
MIEVKVATEIAASAETVWRVLTELPEYAAWNPFIRRASGSLAPGDTVHVHVRTRRGIPLAFSARISQRDEQRSLRWFGTFVSPWLGSGDHSFAIEPLDDHHVRFVQSETFDGMLPRLAPALLEREVRHGFEAMNRELAARAERAEQARS